jgi:hypothetical protein
LQIVLMGRFCKFPKSKTVNCNMQMSVGQAGQMSREPNHVIEGRKLSWYRKEAYRRAGGLRHQQTVIRYIYHLKTDITIMYYKLAANRIRVSVQVNSIYHHKFLYTRPLLPITARQYGQVELAGAASGQGTFIFSRDFFTVQARYGAIFAITVQGLVEHYEYRGTNMIGTRDVFMV